MGSCKYCGKDIGFFSRFHKECEEKHRRGIEGMRSLMHRYFAGVVTTSELNQKLDKNKAPYFLKDDEIANAALMALKAYSESLKRPYPQNTLPLIRDFIRAVNIPYERLNQSGAMDDLGQKLFQGHVVDFFSRGVPISQINISTQSVTSVLPLSSQKKTESYIKVLNKAVEKFMVDGTLTDHEQNLIISYTSSLGLDINNIPIQYRSDTLDRIGQAMILKDLHRGVLPQKSLAVPVILERGEAHLWTYYNVTLFQEKVTKEYKGRNNGLNIRLIKGITYRTGSFKGRPIERSSMEKTGIGELVVTNKNLLFHCPTTTVKIPYKKLNGLTPYSDGLEVHKEETKPKRTVFQGFDAWFILNVISQLNH